MPIPIPSGGRIQPSSTTGISVTISLWAYAEANGIGELVSEDFQHDRMYGSVTVRNPFQARGMRGRPGCLDIRTRRFHHIRGVRMSGTHDASPESRATRA